jgi:serpin B
MNNTFHDKLFAEIFEQKADSFVFSPYSINYIMTMVYQGMDEQTKKEFENVYILPNINYKLINDFITFDQLINHEDLKTANAQFVDESYTSTIKKDFLLAMDKAKFSFNMCDFKHKSQVEREKINTWISKQTNNLIPNMLSKDSIDSNTRIVLVNTLYLKMNWYYPFKSSIGYDFKKLDNSIINVNMMNMKASVKLNYYEDEIMQMVLLPYMSKSSISGNFSMGIFLCKQQFDIITNITHFVNKANNENVNVKIPKFETEFDIELNNIYKKLGMNTLFDEDTCNLNRMTNANDLYVSKIIHKAKIIVDEKGTEACAVTAIEMLRKSKMREKPSKSFIADQAFQYFIMHDQTKTILFSGVFNG